MTTNQIIAGSFDDKYIEYRSDEELLMVQYLESIRSYLHT